MSAAEVTLDGLRCLPPRDQRNAHTEGRGKSGKYTQAPRNRERERGAGRHRYRRAPTHPQWGFTQTQTQRGRQALLGRGRHKREGDSDREKGREKVGRTKGIDWEREKVRRAELSCPPSALKRESKEPSAKVR